MIWIKINKTWLNK